MPLVRISLKRRKSTEELGRISDAVHSAMVETIGIPADDRFQVISEHRDVKLVSDPGYLSFKQF